jgi:hypothetical protein
MRVIRRRFTLLERIRLQLDCGIYWRFMGARSIGQLQTLSRCKYRKVNRAVPLFRFQQKGRAGP